MAMDESSLRKLAFISLISLRKNIKDIKEDFIEEIFVKEFNNDLDNLKRFYNEGILDKGKINLSELDINIYDGGLREPLGFAKIDVYTNGTPMGEISFGKKYCNKTKLLIKIDEILYFFDVEINKLINNN